MDPPTHSRAHHLTVAALLHLLPPPLPQNQMLQQDEEMDKYRLKSSALKAQIITLEAQRAQKEEAGDELQPVDLEALKIEGVHRAEKARAATKQQDAGVGFKRLDRVGEKGECDTRRRDVLLCLFRRWRSAMPSFCG